MICFCFQTNIIMSSCILFYFGKYWEHNNNNGKKCVNNCFEWNLNLRIARFRHGPGDSIFFFFCFYFFRTQNSSKGRRFLMNIVKLSNWIPFKSFTSNYLSSVNVNQLIWLLLVTCVLVNSLSLFLSFFVYFFLCLQLQSGFVIRLPPIYFTLLL